VRKEGCAFGAAAGGAGGAGAGGGGGGAGGAAPSSPSGCRAVTAGAAGASAGSMGAEGAGRAGDGRGGEKGPARTEEVESERRPRKSGAVVSLSQAATLCPSLLSHAGQQVDQMVPQAWVGVDRCRDEARRRGAWPGGKERQGVRRRTMATRRRPAPPFWRTPQHLPSDPAPNLDTPAWICTILLVPLGMEEAGAGSPRGARAEGERARQRRGDAARPSQPTATHLEQAATAQTRKGEGKEGGSGALPGVFRRANRASLCGRREGRWGERRAAATRRAGTAREKEKKKGAHGSFLSQGLSALVAACLSVHR